MNEKELHSYVTTKTESLIGQMSTWFNFWHARMKGGNKLNSKQPRIIKFWQLFETFLKDWLQDITKSDYLLRGQQRRRTTLSLCWACLDK